MIIHVHVSLIHTHAHCIVHVYDIYSIIHVHLLMSHKNDYRLINTQVHVQYEQIHVSCTLGYLHAHVCNNLTLCWSLAFSRLAALEDEASSSSIRVVRSFT